ncbi:MAG: DNA topoisomerase IB [Actinomycetota bacterium]
MAHLERVVEDDLATPVHSQKPGGPSTTGATIEDHVHSQPLEAPSSGGILNPVVEPCTINPFHYPVCRGKPWFEKRVFGGSSGMTNWDDSPVLALEAGLRYIESGAPGYRRVRRGKSFVYLSDDGEVLNGRVRKWIENLVIPPAWEDVWISSDPRGHILATGHDAAGRKQYIYHPDWEVIRDEVKFDRLVPFGDKLVELRKSIDNDLRTRGLPRRKVVSLTVAVLDRTLLRVGNRRYAAENDSYGLTTLTCEHIEVDGPHVHLEFTGKGGAEHQLVFGDRRLAGLVSRCQELSGQTLFSYETGDGDVGSVTSSDVNGYLSDILEGPFTAKDVRTWGASSLVVGELGRGSEDTDVEARLRDAIDVAAERLGNTRDVCRASYVHPRVLAANEDGSLDEIWPKARGGKWVSRDESALRALLDGP